jgi:hypothetical protein
MRTQLPFALLATAVACSFVTTPAHARARVFVASYGNDANPCTFGSPCKTFQQAVNVVDAGGEVTAIDSAGFGPLNITKAVTITSPAGVEAGIVPAAGADAIDINAGANDAIVLRGLTLNGSSVGSNGIVLNSGGSLTVTNCVAQNFVGNSNVTGNGIFIQPTSGSISFTITDTLVSSNSHFGILYLPPLGSSANATGVIDHVTATYNQFGIANIPSSSGTTVVALSNSVASNNVSDGIIANNSGPLTLSIDNATVSGNGTFGILAINAAKVLLGRSVITGNGTGVSNNTSSNTFYSYGDNRINLNGTDGFSSLNTAFVTH